MASMNLELRTCDPACNPYLALGGLLAAGFDGLTQQLHPGPPMGHSPAVLGHQEHLQGDIRPLPETLEAALEALQHDPVLTQALGADLTQDYLMVKRAEVAACQEPDPEGERARYLTVY
jgi:glutamine synthetase